MQSWQKCLPYVQGNTFRKNFFYEKNIILPFFWLWLKKAPFFDTSSRQACLKPESMWPGKVFEKSLLGKTYIFVSFYGLSKEKSFCKETLRLPRRHSTSPVDHSEGQISRRNKILQTFEIWARIFWVFGETKLAELLKLPSMCPGKNFKKKDCSGNNHSFDSNFWFWGKKFSIFGNNFREGCQNRTARDRENFVKKVFLEVKTIFFLVFWRNFDSPKNKRFLRKASYQSSGTFRGTVFWDKQKVSIFRTLSENLQDFLTKQN